MKGIFNIMEKGLGRIHIPDSRDEKFPMKSVLPKKSPSITYKYWWPGGWWGDQKDTPQCVAYSWLHWLEDGSITQDHAEPPVIQPTTLYNQCQKNDVWIGENYEGTSVRAGAKVLQEKGYISEYRWTWDVNELAFAILTTAPVVVGTDWFYDMFYPNKDGVISATGAPMGGHAYILNGVNMKKRLFRIKNSWGRSWGKNGYAYITFTDMQKLLDNYGEACLALEIRK